MEDQKKTAAKTTAKKTDAKPETIYAALAMFQSNCPPIKKDTEAGTKFKYKYGSLPHVLEAIKPHMAAAGLGFTQPIVLDGEREVIKTVLFHVTDEKTIESTIELPDFKFDQMNAMQSKGSIITYLRRYSLMSVLGIVAEEDDNDAQGEGKKTSKGTKAAPATTTTQPNATAELPWLNPEIQGKTNVAWKKAVKYLAEGGKISDIKKKYRIGKNNEERLLNESLNYTEDVVDVEPEPENELDAHLNGNVSDIGPDQPNTLFDDQGNINPE